MVSTWWFIRQGDTRVVYSVAKALLKDREDLIHKAVGWMLREAGKKDRKKLESFLTCHLEGMPRVTLRYAIEKFPKKLQRKYLKMST